MREVALTVTVNGERLSRTVEARRTLADFLRDDLGLTGTHLGCEHGVCGACTVLVDGDAVRSCLMFAVQADGAEVTTIEGLVGARRRSDPDPGGLPGRTRAAMWVLHAGFRRLGTRVPGRAPEPIGRGDPQRAVGQPVPMHGVSRDHRRGAVAAAASKAGVAS